MCGLAFSCFLLGEKSLNGQEVVNLLDEEGELDEEKKKNVEEEDWLPPPPKMRSISSAVFEDNTLKALRYL